MHFEEIADTFHLVAMQTRVLIEIGLFKQSREVPHKERSYAVFRI